MWHVPVFELDKLSGVHLHYVLFVDSCFKIAL